MNDKLLLLGEGSGTMFSISLPMQRISENMEAEIAKLPSFGHYSHPALDCRLANDLQRSQMSQKSHQSHQSQKLVKFPKDHSLQSINVGDIGITSSLIPITQSLSLQQQQQQQPQTQTSSLQPSSITNHRVVTPDVVQVNDTEKYRILLVDDSPLNRKMLSKLLKSKGYNIEEAADGQIAVDKIKQEADAGRSYDVILMDFVMPVMDGPTATRAIRAMHILTPIFGLTGRLG